MLLALFALALVASARGWFPWSVAVFALPYLLSIVDTNAVSAESSVSLFGFALSAGGVLEWTSAMALISMVLYARD